MSIGKGVTQVNQSAAATSLNSAADVLVVAPVKPINLQRFGVIVDSATASGTTLVLSVDKRPTAGSDTGREELATLSPTATVEQGKGVYFDFTARHEINPGEEVVVEVKTAAGVAATGRVFLESVPYPFQRTGKAADDDRLSNMTEEE